MILVIGHKKCEVGEIQRAALRPSWGELLPAPEAQLSRITLNASHPHTHQEGLEDTVAAAACR